MSVRRFLICTLGVAGLLSAFPAYAQPNDQANRAAYGHAMKCFVANGHARGMRQRAGDEAKAAAYETKARMSFDTAVKLGRALGYSGDRMDQDFGLAQTRELPAMVSDQKYFVEAAATCKALGLM